MRVIFVGGPGRSGTSYVASRLGSHPQVCTFPDVELKFLTEKGGLLDLKLSLVEHYSPNRAAVAVEQFRRLFEALIEGKYGQPALKSFASAESFQAIFEVFIGALRMHGHTSRLGEAAFMAHGRRLISQIADLCARAADKETGVTTFVEKTPHALLEPEFLNSLAQDKTFIHVMRDPRSIAKSLQKMRWAPDALEACCEWVASYCEAFAQTQIRTADVGIALTCIRVEELADRPSAMSIKVCESAHLRPVPDLFQDVSTGTLNNWATTCAENERAYLDDRLSGWAHYFGYARSSIGEPIC